MAIKKKRRAGRPRLKVSKVVVPFAVVPEKKKELEAIAAKEGHCLSSLLRKICTDYLAKRKETIGV